MGRMGVIAVAKNAIPVVKDVAKMALDARRAAYSILWDKVGSAMTVFSSSSDWWKASRNTKTSSAPIPGGP